MLTRTMWPNSDFPWDTFSRGEIARSSAQSVRTATPHRLLRGNERVLQHAKNESCAGIQPWNRRTNLIVEWGGR
jgi:hypothetical protein